MLVAVEKYLWEEKDIIVVMGDFTNLIEGREAYNSEFNIPEFEDAQAVEDLEQLMIAAALTQLVAQEQESFGWTVRLPGKNYGLFAAAEPEGAICGRVLYPVKDDQPKMIVQRSQPYSPIFESSIEPSSSDILKAVEEYFEDAEQIATKVVCDCSVWRGVLLRALPGAKFSEVENKSTDEIIELIDSLKNKGKLSFLSQMRVFYGCRCNPEMILSLFLSLPKDKRDELVLPDGSVSIECPRCGRVYQFRRQQFEGK